MVQLPTERMEYSDLTDITSFWNRLQDHCSRRIQLMKFNQRLTPQSTRSRHLYNENRLCNSCNSEKWKSRAGCYFWTGFADHMKLINIMNVKGIFIWALSFRMLSLHKLISICNCNFVKKCHNLHEGVTTTKSTQCWALYTYIHLTTLNHTVFRSRGRGYQAIYS